MFRKTLTLVAAGLLTLGTVAANSQAANAAPTQSHAMERTQLVGDRYAWGTTQAQARLWADQLTLEGYFPVDNVIYFGPLEPGGAFVYYIVMRPR